MNKSNRNQKANQIFSEAKSIRKITKNQYSVDSQTSDKSIWREINDILRLSEFSWLSNGRESCWLKPTP